MLELVGSMASEPIDNEGWLSVIGVQFKPASIVFQTPPAAAPRKATSGFLGSTASAATRPELLGLPLKGNTPGATLIGCGPIEVHAEGPEKSVAKGAAISKGSKRIIISVSVLRSYCINAHTRMVLDTQPACIVSTRCTS